MAFSWRTIDEVSNIPPEASVVERLQSKSRSFDFGEDFGAEVDQSPGSDGGVAVLERITDPLQERIGELKTESVIMQDPKLSEFRVYQRQKKSSASASVSVAPFFKGDGSHDDFTYSYFAGAFSDRYRYTPGNDGSAIIAERFGLGVEINLSVSKIKTAIKGGFLSIAAAVSMEIAEAEYSYHVRALPQGSFSAMLPPVGTFDIKAIEKFQQLVKRLKELYKQNIGKFELVAIEVLLAESLKEDNAQYADSYYFAAKRIADGRSLSEAIKLARQAGTYNEDAIQYLYSRVGVASLDEVPSSTAIGNAKTMFFLQ